MRKYSAGLILYILLILFLTTSIVSCVYNPYLSKETKNYNGKQVLVREYGWLEVNGYDTDTLDLYFTSGKKIYHTKVVKFEEIK